MSSAKGTYRGNIDLVELLISVVSIMSKIRCFRESHSIDRRRRANEVSRGHQNPKKNIIGKQITGVAILFK